MFNFDGNLKLKLRETLYKYGRASESFVSLQHHIIFVKVRRKGVPMNNSKILQGKTVLITGASSGIGEACAIAFAAKGAHLINIARRKDRLDALEQELKSKYKTDVTSIVLDVADTQAVKKELNQLSHVPDILLNNAGLAKGLNKVWETPPEDWNLMMDVNVKGLLNVSHEIIPKMLKANSGHIINVGSIAGHDTYPGGGIYCATKYAVRAITDTLRKELVETPLRVSMISPGLVETEFSKVRFSGDETKAESVYQNIEALTPEDIAEIVVFMASRPPHVAIADVIVYPTNQASATMIHRK